MTDIPDEIMAKAREVVAKFPTPPDNRNACVNIVAAALSERTASEAALKEALTDRPGEMLDDEDLDTISACVRSDQHGRILGLELWELIRVYRAARAFLAKTGGA